MAVSWTDPRTYTVGELITKVIMDTHIRDNLKWLFGDYYASRSRFEDDFVGGVATTGLLGENGWALTNTVTYQAGIAAHPGVVRLDTGASSGTRVVINTQLGTAMVPTDTFEMLAIVRLNTNDANTTTRIGLTGATGSNPPNDGIYFQKLDAGTQWTGVTRASSSQTISSNVAATSTAWVLLRLRRVNGTTIGFSVNGGTEQTLTLTIPTVGLSPFVEIINSTTASKTIDVDFIRLDITGISR